MSSTICKTLGGTPPAESIRFMAFLLAWNHLRCSRRSTLRATASLLPNSARRADPRSQLDQSTSIP
eukprot:458468-Pyramimonas_sp.AAC.1